MLNNEDKQDIDDRINLYIRAYMQELVETHLPRIVDAALRAHDSNVSAHQKQLEIHQRTCPTGAKLNRALYICLGAAFGGGIGSGIGLTKLLSFLVS